MPVQFDGDIVGVGKSRYSGDEHVCFDAVEWVGFWMPALWIYGSNGAVGPAVMVAAQPRDDDDGSYIISYHTDTAGPVVVVVVVRSSAACRSWFCVPWFCYRFCVLTSSDKFLFLR